MLQFADTESRRGTGSAPAHHGEIIQGAFMTDKGVVRGLLSLPCPLYESRAVAVLTTETNAISVVPHWKFKAQAAARVALDAIGLGHAGAQVTVCGHAPICRGFGSSTSDVIATIRAVLAAAGLSMTDAALAKLAVVSEVASDGLMFGAPVLFAQRAGIVLERFADAFPPILVLGFSTSAEGVGIPTVDFPPAPYSDADVARFEELRSGLRQAFASHDVKTIGAIATESAWINQRHLPVPNFDALEEAAADVGAVGLQVAHSGDIASFLYDRRDSGVQVRLGHARDRLAQMGIVRTWEYLLPSNTKHHRLVLGAARARSKGFSRPCQPRSKRIAVNLR